MNKAWTPPRHKIKGQNQTQNKLDVEPMTGTGNVSVPVIGELLRD